MKVPLQFPVQGVPSQREVGELCGSSRRGRTTFEAAGGALAAQTQGAAFIGVAQFKQQRTHAVSEAAGLANVAQCARGVHSPHLDGLEQGAIKLTAARGALRIDTAPTAV